METLIIYFDHVETEKKQTQNSAGLVWSYSNTLPTAN